MYMPLLTRLSLVNAVIVCLLCLLIQSSKVSWLSQPLFHKKWAHHRPTCYYPQCLERWLCAAEKLGGLVTGNHVAIDVEVQHTVETFVHAGKLKALTHRSHDIVRNFLARAAVKTTLEFHLLLAVHGRQDTNTFLAVRVGEAIEDLAPLLDGHVGLVPHNTLVVADGLVGFVIGLCRYILDHVLEDLGISDSGLFSHGLDLVISAVLIGTSAGASCGGCGAGSALTACRKTDKNDDCGAGIIWLVHNINLAAILGDVN